MRTPPPASAEPLRRALAAEALRRLTDAFPATEFRLEPTREHEAEGDPLALDLYWSDGPAAAAVEELLAPLTPVLAVPGVGEVSCFAPISALRWLSTTTHLTLLLSFELHSPGALAPLQQAAENLVARQEHQLTLAARPDPSPAETLELRALYYGSDTLPGVPDLLDELTRERWILERRAAETLLGAELEEISLPHPALLPGLERARLAMSFERPSQMGVGDLDTAALSWALARGLSAADACLVAL